MMEKVKKNLKDSELANKYIQQQVENINIHKDKQHLKHKNCKILWILITTIQWNDLKNKKTII